MLRPALLLKNNTLTWVIRIYNTSGALVDADSTPTVAVRKNGSSTGDSVTPTKRSATTGIYDCSYNPASEVEGDQFTIEETATVSSTTTSWNWSFMVIDSDVTGKVLGGGEGTISGVGAYVKDHAGSAVATASDMTTALGVLQSGSYGNSAIKTALDAVAAQITGLNNLSALINIYGSPLLEIPDSSSTAFAFTVVVRDSEGKLVDLDASPTIAASNAAGTDRSVNLSVVSHPATGRYTFTYSVSSAATEESLRITVSGAVSAEGRYIEWIGAVVNYDTLTTLNTVASNVSAIHAKLPSKSYLVGTTNSDGDLQLDEATGTGTVTLTSTTRVKLDATQPDYAPAKAGDAMALTSGERTTLAGVIWSALTSGLTTVGSIGKYLIDRIIGTLAAGTHNPQSGDGYPSAVSAASSASSAASSASTASVAAAATLVIVDHADYGNEALADAIAAIDVGTGNGPNQVDVIVSSSAGGTVQGVSVRIKATGLGDHTATTNSSGVARFNLPSGTWNLTASLNGYSYSGSTQVISTNPQEVPITMTVTSVSTPSSPSKSVGVLLCLDTSGDPESGVTVSFQMVAGPGDDGYSLDAAIVEEDCDSEGVLEREFLRGATYDAWRGVRGARVRFVVPDTASFNLPEQLGVD